ncbi:hypothetical protein [Neorhizobium alkalisoli]|uniref:Uncharacterized protein n=1 Tax=Neorhizobium alkalisoli TaxID=528178 RepID=A0A561QWA3_9HYPH|nr:hypothetical protein [Neorhizobium alkalisoli]TWF54654.1 hypothetical protein FHW37_103524 [Neorhizobium alkalisoli]
MLKKIVSATSAILASLSLGFASPAFSADFGDLAGTYSGKTAKGGDVLIVIPKSGNPTYRFRGAPVMVSSAKLSGKSIVLNVGSAGMGSIVLTPAGKGKMSYSYKDSWGGSASASLTKG